MRASSAASKRRGRATPDPGCVQRHVDEHARRVLDGLEALVPALGGAELRERVGDRLAGAPVPCVPAQHRGLERPMLEDLRRQLDEVAQHLRSRQPLVRDARDSSPCRPWPNSWKSVRTSSATAASAPAGACAKLLWLAMIGSASPPARDCQRWRSSMRRCVARGARSVGEEDTDRRVIAVAHLVHAHVGMIGRQVPRAARSGCRTGAARSRTSPRSCGRARSTI